MVWWYSTVKPWIQLPSKEERAEESLSAWAELSSFLWPCPSVEPGVQIYNIRAVRDWQNGMENAVEMVVRIVSQGQAVPKNRSGFGIMPDTAAGIVLEEDLGWAFFLQEVCSVAVLVLGRGRRGKSDRSLSDGLEWQCPFLYSQRMGLAHPA